MSGFINLKALVLIFILLLAAFLAIGLAVYFITSPEALFKSMMKKMSKLETVHYDFQFEGIGDLVLAGSQIQGLGYSEEYEKISGKVKAEIEGDMEFKAGVMPYTADASLTVRPGQEDSYRIDFEQVVTESNIYIKPKSFPKNDEIDLTPFAGKWILEREDFLQQFIPQIVMSKYELAPEQVVDLRELISKTKLFDIKQKIGYTFFGFNLVRGFKAGLNKENAVEFLKDYKLISEGRGWSADEMQILEHTLDQIQDMEIEVWLGWSSKYLQQILVKGVYIYGANDFRFVFILEFSKFDTEIKIQDPTGAKRADEVLRGIGGLPRAGEREGLTGEGDGVLPGQLPTAEGVGGEEEVTKDVGFRDRDGDGLYDTFEFTMGTDPQNPDSDGDGVSDGEEIKQGTNPLGEGMLFEYR